ncbi:MAG TPA: alpha/beta hydrolase [Terriglobales bacterium]|nr:alpha/beta hydrolase [Terriglobales bacterium]
MLLVRLLGVVALIVACSLLSSAQIPEAVRSAVLVNHAYDVNSNIVYKAANNVELKLDVYHSREAKGPTPVVMMIHGGGWIVSNKDDYMLTAGPYLAMGFSVVNVEYRLGKVSPAPAAVDDCLCALRWIGAHAKDYNFDLTKLIITGPSAGGHLALTTGMIPASTGFGNDCANIAPPNEPLPKVAAIINLFGITDVADLLQGPNLRTYAVTWLGSQSGREEMAKRLSPLTYVRMGVPPVLTIHGDADPTVPYSHAVRLHEALQKAGVRNQLLTIPGAGHGGFTAEQDVLAFETTIKFLESLGIRAVN